MAQHKPGHQEFKFEIEIQYKKSSSKTFQSDVQTLQCQLHEYVYLSYIINNSNVLKDFNDYLIDTDKMFCLFVDNKHLCVLLPEKKSRSNINCKGVLKDLKERIQEFGEKFLVFKLLSPQYLKKTKELADSISIQYEQVTIGGKVAIVVAKTDEDKFRSGIMQTPDNVQTPDNQQSRRLKGCDRERVIDIQVIQGSLEQTKADVLVCTVAETLNLSFGATSHALAQAAGRKLQEELNKNYPDGLVIPHEVAYANGYKLPCTEVYLMAVPPLYQAKVDNIEIVHEEVRQNVETVMEATLLKATQKGYKSIAYPAIGTGMQKYPQDIVAQQMVESVKTFKKRYPDTKLDKVTFVIFKDDKMALDVFNKFVQKSVKAMTALKPIIYGNIAGTSEDVKKAKALMVNEMSQSASGMKSMSEASSVSSRAINADSSEMPVKQKDTPAQASCISMTEINSTRSKMSGSQKNGQQSLIPSITKKYSFEERVPIDEFQYKLLQHFYGPEVHKLHYIDGYAVISAGNSTLLDKANQGFTKKLSHVRKLQSSIYTPTKVLTSPEDGAQLCQKYCNDKTFCCYDNGEFHIYGILYEDVTSAKHQLEIDLGDLHVQREKDRCFQNASDLRSRKPSDSKETKPQLQFSWKSDTENLKVFEVNKMSIKVYVGDILNVPVEAIVNAANENLKHCVGIYNVILNAAGKKLDEECDKHVKAHGSLQTADVFASSAGNLPYKHVLHAVGPKWINYQPPTLDNIKRCEKDLRYTINRCFITAEVKQLESVAFPAVSSAIFGCPVDLCAVQYARAIMAYRPCGHLKEIHFVDWNKQVVALVQKALECLQMKKDPDFYNRNAYVKTNPYPDLLSVSSHETVTIVKPELSKGTNRNTDGTSTMKPQTLSKMTDQSRITARDSYYSSRSHGGTMYTTQSETDCVSGAKTEPPAIQSETMFLEPKLNLRPSNRRQTVFRE